MRIAVMMIAVIGLLIACGNQDEKPPEELAAPELTAVKGPRAAETPVEEPDCAPHPFDVMAIYALYQSVP